MNIPNKILRFGKIIIGNLLTKRFLLFLRLTLGLGLLCLLFYSIEIKGIAKRIDSLNFLSVAVLCIIAASDRILMAYKWNLLLRVRNITISVWKAVRLYFVGGLFGTFTPAAIGGDIYRVAALSYLKKNDLVASTILIERIIGLIVIMLIALITLPLSLKYMGINSNSIFYILSIGIILLSILFYILIHPEFFAKWMAEFPLISRLDLFKKIQKFYSTFAEFRSHVKILLTFILLTSLELAVVITINYLAAISLNIYISLTYMFCVMPLVHILLRIPITLYGLGVQEGIFAYIFVVAGFSAADGLMVSMLLRIVSLVVIFIPATIMLISGPTRHHIQKGDSIKMNIKDRY